MRRLLLILSILTLTSFSLFAQDYMKRTYDLGKITSIESGYIYKINVTKGNSNTVEVVYPKRLEKTIYVGYSNGTLKLHQNTNARNLSSKNSGSITVTLSMQTINAIDLSGASSCTITGDFHTNSFKCELSGASSLSKLNISANDVEFDISGATYCEICGNFQRINGDVSGAASLKLIGNASIIEMDNSGASHFEYNGNVSELIKIENSGASSSVLTGSTKELSSSCSGSSALKGNKFKSQNAKISVSGASSASVNVSNTLTTQTSGVSKIFYSGNPTNIIDNTRNKSIIKCEK